MIERPTTQDIVVHGSWTRPGTDIGADEIREWHLARGWSDIGYHFVIRRDGTIEEGRDAELRGAHVQTHNAYTIGVCLVGGKSDIPARIESDAAWDFNYTFRQIVALGGLIGRLMEEWPEIHRVKGHRDYPHVTKNCPGFDVKAFFGRNARLIR